MSDLYVAGNVGSVSPDTSGLSDHFYSSVGDGPGAWDLASDRGSLLSNCHWVISKPIRKMNLQNDLHPGFLTLDVSWVLPYPTDVLGY